MNTESCLIVRAHDRVALGGECCSCSFWESGSWVWGARFSDDVSHILVGVHHGCCSRAVTRGIETCVLDDVNARSFAGSGWGSFGGVHYTGFTDGDFRSSLWDLCLDKYNGDGRFDGGVDHDNFR